MIVIQSHEYNGFMIVYKHYWYYRFVFYFIFLGGMTMFLTSLALIILFRPSMTIDNLILYLFFFGVLMTVWLFLWSFNSKLIIKVESEVDQYHLTSLNNKSILLDPLSVKRIKHGERYHQMFLKNGKILYFERRLTMRGFLSTQYYDPWTVFLTQSRFPDAEIQ
jgi:hypothetical protein